MRGNHSFFFFQAEDGIRDLTVTGVQTCALPIFGDAAGGVVHQPWLLTGDVEQFDSIAGELRLRQDRKSTRLNSSHSQISYAVFCLKKKKKKKKKKRITKDKIIK